MYLNGTKVNGIDDIVNFFARKFGSVYTSSNFPYKPISSIINDCINTMTFSVEEVIKCIDELSDKLSEGPDKINILFIKKCKEVLVTPITELFNLSIRLGFYPTLFKQSFVSPVFKSGDPHDVASYRPIVKINILAKLFEKLVFNKLYDYMVRYVIEEQHGFFCR